jgi:hypothetical protein
LDAADEELETVLGPSLVDLALAHEQFLMHTISRETDELIQVEPTSAVAVILKDNTSRMLNPTENRLTAA